MKSFVAQCAKTVVACAILAASIAQPPPAIADDRAVESNNSIEVTATRDGTPGGLVRIDLRVRNTSETHPLIVDASAAEIIETGTAGILPATGEQVSEQPESKQPITMRAGRPRSQVFEQPEGERPITKRAASISEVLAVLHSDAHEQARRRRALIFAATAGLGSMVVNDYRENIKNPLQWLGGETADRNLGEQFFERRMINPGDSTRGYVYFRISDLAQPDSLRLPVTFLRDDGSSTETMQVSIDPATPAP